MLYLRRVIIFFKKFCFGFNQHRTHFMSFEKFKFIEVRRTCRNSLYRIQPLLFVMCLQLQKVNKDLSAVMVRIDLIYSVRASPNAISFIARGNCRSTLYHLAYKLIIIQMESFRYFYLDAVFVGFDLSIAQIIFYIYTQLYLLPLPYFFRVE